MSRKSTRSNSFVVVTIGHNFDVIALTAAIKAFRANGIATKVVSLGKSKQVTSSAKLKVQADMTLAEAISIASKITVVVITNDDISKALERLLTRTPKAMCVIKKILEADPRLPENQKVLPPNNNRWHIWLGQLGIR